jgi:hypothetical protein
MGGRSILNDMFSITFFTVHLKPTDVKCFTCVVLHLLLSKSRVF